MDLTGNKQKVLILVLYHCSSGSIIKITDCERNVLTLVKFQTNRARYVLTCNEEKMRKIFRNKLHAIYLRVRFNSDMYRKSANMRHIAAGN